MQVIQKDFADSRMLLEQGNLNANHALTYVGSTKRLCYRDDPISFDSILLESEPILLEC